MTTSTSGSLSRTTVNVPAAPPSARMVDGDSAVTVMPTVSSSMLVSDITVPDAGVLLSYSGSASDDDWSSVTVYATFPSSWPGHQRAQQKNTIRLGTP